MGKRHFAQEVRTTPNQARASAKKRLNQQARRAELEQEAAAKGISVEALSSLKYREVQEAIAASHAGKVVVSRSQAELDREARYRHYSY